MLESTVAGRDPIILGRHGEALFSLKIGTGSELLTMACRLLAETNVRLLQQRSHKEHSHIYFVHACQYSRARGDVMMSCRYFASSRAVAVTASRHCAVTEAVDRYCPFAQSYAPP